MPEMGNFAFGQTMLPEWSIIIGQKMVKNAKIEKLKCDILTNFQTLWNLTTLVLLVYVVKGRDDKLVCVFLIC